MGGSLVLMRTLAQSLSHSGTEIVQGEKHGGPSLPQQYCLPTYRMSHTGDTTMEKTVRMPVLMLLNMEPITDKYAILFQKASATLADIPAEKRKHIKGILT